MEYQTSATKNLAKEKNKKEEKERKHQKDNRPCSLLDDWGSVSILDSD